MSVISIAPADYTWVCAAADGTLSHSGADPGVQETSTTTDPYAYGTSTFRTCGAGLTLLKLEISPEVGLSVSKYTDGQSFQEGFIWQSNALPAADAPTPGEQGGPASELEKQTTCATGDPVNCATGTLVEPATDISISGRGPGLQWARTYSSSNAATDGPLGYGWASSYGSQFQVTGNNGVQVGPDGSQTPWLFSAGFGWTAPTRVLATLTRNTNDRTVTSLKTHDSMVYALNGQLTSVVDRTGLATTLAYDGAGHLATATDNSNRILTFTWTGTHITSVKDPLGRTTTYGYDANGNLATVTDAASRVVTYGYDAGHQLTTVTDANLRVTTNTFTAGKVTKQVDPMNRATTFGFSGDPASTAGSTSTVTDSHGMVTKHTYAQMTLTSETVAFGTAAAATTSFYYDPLTLGLTALVDPTGQVWREEFDTHGNVTATDDPTGASVHRTYDANDHLASEVSGTGVEQDWSYTASGGTLTQLLQSSTQKNTTATTTYTYGDSAHPTDLTGVKDAAGRITNYTYDTFGDVATSSVTATGGIIQTSEAKYDADSELTCSVTAATRALGVHCPTAGAAPVGASSAVYDGSGLIKKTTDALGHATTMVRDGNGNLTSTTDPAGLITKRVYDKDNRITSTTTAYGTADASTITAKYDIKPATAPCVTATSVAWCGTTTDGLGKVTVTAYNILGRPVQAITPSGATTKTTYDLASRPKIVTAPDGTFTTTGYDFAGRILTRTSSSGTPAPVTYTYDLDGRRSTMTDGPSAANITTYGYGLAGKLASVASKLGATTNTVLYGYDPSGLTSSITYPSGRVVTQGYDTAARMTSVADSSADNTHPISLGFDANGNLITDTVPTPGTTGTAATITTTYDAANAARAVTAKNGAAATIASFTYTRNNDYQILTETAAGSATSGGTYTYNNTGRLATSGPTGSTTTYAFDLAGHPTTQAGSTQTFNSDGQVLTASASGITPARTFGYNPNGDRTSTTSSGTSYTLGYDQSSQMTSSTATTSGTPTTTTYTYDGDGLRTSKTTGGVTTTFTYDLNGAVPKLLSDGTTDYIYGPCATPLEQAPTTAAHTTPANAAYYLHDQHGDTRALIAGNGTVAATYTYTPSGQVAASSTPGATTNLQYGTGYRDTETGLIYLITRYYDPGTGQFTTVDPALAVTQAPYGYDDGDPLNRWDPLGRDWYNPASWTQDGPSPFPHTYGGCVTVSAGYGIGGEASACAGFSLGQHGWNFFTAETLGGGLSTPQAGVGVAAIISNAIDPDDLSGWFGTAAGSVGEVGRGAVQVAGGYNCSGSFIWTVQPGISLSPSIFPAEAHGGASYTWVQTPAGRNH